MSFGENALIVNFSRIVMYGVYHRADAGMTFDGQRSYRNCLAGRRRF
jgi:hypothetical protein